MPGPGQYKVQLCGSAVYERVLGGPTSKGAKKTYVENTVFRAKSTPAPNHYKNPDKFTTHVSGPSFDERKNGTGKYKGRGLTNPNDVPG